MRVYSSELRQAHIARYREVAEARFQLQQNVQKLVGEYYEVFPQGNVLGVSIGLMFMELSTETTAQVGRIFDGIETVDAHSQQQLRKRSQELADLSRQVSRMLGAFVTGGRTD